MNLEQFKDALIQAIYQHFCAISQEEHFYVRLDLPHNPKAVGLELSPTQWRLVPILDPSYEKILESRSLKTIYELLLKTIIQAEQGYDLWQEIQAQTNTLPGWWQFFAPLRPLNSALNNILKEFEPSELKEEDDSVFKSRIRALLEEVQQLMQQIQQLIKKCNFLEEQFERNNSNEEVIYTLQESYNTLEEKNKQCLLEYRKFKDLWLQEKKNVQQEHEKEKKELEDIIVIMAEEITTLKQKLLRQHVIVEDTDALPNIPQGNIQEGNSQEIMRLQNQNYRGGGRGGIITSRRGRASQVGMYQIRPATNNNETTENQNPYQERQPGQH